MTRRTTLIRVAVLCVTIGAGAAAWRLAQPSEDVTVSVLTAADDQTAATMAAAQPEAFGRVLEALRQQFDESVHSARDTPEQRRVQYDAAALEQGLRLAGIYASVTADRRPLRLVAARQLRIEGTELLNQREYQAALVKLAEALDEAERLDDPWLQIITLTNQAYGQLEGGDADAALQSSERARALAARHDPRSRALTTFNLATLHMHLGQYHESISLSREAIDLARGLENRLWEGNALLNLGGAHRQLGQLDEAREVLERGRDVLLRTKDRLGIGRTYYALALVAGDSGDYRTAVTQMELALPVIRSVDIRHSHAIEDGASSYFNPIEEASLTLLSTWYGELDDAARSAEYAKAREALRTNRPHERIHSHEP